MNPLTTPPLGFWVLIVLIVYATSVAVSLVPSLQVKSSRRSKNPVLPSSL